jgi:sulfate/thiosulfate transport system ATP-binding protein
MGIRVAAVSKQFGAFRAVDNVSLDVDTGSLVALLGPSGSGKSTLLRLIAGLEEADDGRIWITGEEATSRSAQERQVGFVFQHFALFKHRSVRQNVGFGLELRGWSPATIKRRVDELLELMQLQGFGNRYPSQLSGGQRQRVALARALAVQPRVLLLDEPFSALDAKVRKELRAWLRNLHDEMHVTTVIVTHDQEEAMEVADRIVVMNHGRIEQIGSPAEIYDQPASPFVMRFVGAVNVLPAHVPLAPSGAAVAGGSASGAAGGARGGAAEAAAAAVAGEPQQRGDLFIRPHDLELHRTPRSGSVPAVLRRLTHMGRDIQAELILGSGETVMAQLPRERIDYHDLKAGDALHITSREARTFVPDFVI